MQVSLHALTIQISSHNDGSHESIMLHDKLLSALSHHNVHLMCCRLLSIFIVIYRHKCVILVV